MGIEKKRYLTSGLSFGPLEGDEQNLLVFVVGFLIEWNREMMLVDGNPQTNWNWPEDEAILTVVRDINIRGSNESGELFFQWGITPDLREVNHESYFTAVGAVETINLDTPHILPRLFMCNFLRLAAKDIRIKYGVSTFNGICNLQNLDIAVPIYGGLLFVFHELAQTDKVDIVLRHDRILKTKD